MTIRVTEFNGITTLHCLRCGDLLSVDNKNVRKAYKDINVFRGSHEHLERYKREK